MWLILNFHQFFFCFLLLVFVEFIPGFCWFCFRKWRWNHQSSMESSIPMERLMVVLLRNFFVFKLILLQKLKKSSISTHSPRDTHQLVIVPIFAKNLLWIASLKPVYACDYISALFTNKWSKVDYAMSWWLRFAVNAEFIVGICEHILQVVSQFWRNPERRTFKRNYWRFLNFFNSTAKLGTCSWVINLILRRRNGYLFFLLFFLSGQFSARLSASFLFNLFNLFNFWFLNNLWFFV